MQNGIDHVARVAPLAGGAAVVPVLVYYNGERLAPDRVRLRHAGAHDLLAADDDAGEAFAQLFAGTELRVVLSGDFLYARLAQAVPQRRRQSDHGADLAAASGVAATGRA